MKAKPHSGAWQIFSAILAISSLLAIFYIYTSGIKVSITNKSGVTLEAVKIYYTPGKIEFGRIDNNNTASIKIHPDRESAMRIAISTTYGRTASHDLDIYFDHSYRGLLALTILNDLSVDITSYPIP